MNDGESDCGGHRDLSMKREPNVKAISIQQPWAWAIVHAGKDIENRTWSTAYRGDVAVHATRMQKGYRLPPGVAAPTEQELTLGAVIGLVEIVDVVMRSSSCWFTGPLGFVLRNPRPLVQPIRCPGNQRIWELPRSIASAIRTHLPAGQQTSVKSDSAPPRTREPKPLAKRLLKVTQGNINNNHLYLRGIIDLFPTDVLGGGNQSQQGRTVRVLWNDESVETDIVRSRNIFRRRGWLRKFFAANHIIAGDRVMLEQMGPYLFRMSKALD